MTDTPPSDTPQPGTPLTLADLLHAARGGDTAAVEAMLETEPALARAVDASGRTALHDAALRGDLDTAWMLLDTGADPSGAPGVRDPGPLVEAVREGRMEMVQLLVANGASMGVEAGDPLRQAARRGQAAIRKLLAEVGAVEARLPDPESPEEEPAGVFRMAWMGDAAGLSARLGADPSLAAARDRDGWTPLHAAAVAGETAAVEALLRAGADPAAVNGAGRTAMQEAAADRQVEVVRHLIARGAPCDLGTAVRFGDAERVVRFLGEDPEALDRPLPGGLTPLRTALLHGEKAMVRLLLDRGAVDPDDVARRFLRGQTVRDLEMAATLFQRLNLRGSSFVDVALARATFHDADLSGSVFRNVNLSGARLDDVSLAGAVIEESCIDGLRIWGVEIRPLVEAELARRAADGEPPRGAGPG